MAAAENTRSPELQKAIDDLVELVRRRIPGTEEVVLRVGPGLLPMIDLQGQEIDPEQAAHIVEIDMPRDDGFQPPEGQDFAIVWQEYMDRIALENQDLIHTLSQELDPRALYLITQTHGLLNDTGVSISDSPEVYPYLRSAW